MSRSDRNATLISAAVGVLAAVGSLVVLLASSDSAPAATASLPGSPGSVGGGSTTGNGAGAHLTPAYLQAHFPEPPGTHVNALNPDATKPGSAGADLVYLDLVAPQSILEVRAFYQRELLPLGLKWNPADDGHEPGTSFNGSLDSGSNAYTSYGDLAVSALGNGHTEIQVFLLRHPG